LALLDRISVFAVPPVTGKGGGGASEKKEAGPMCGRRNSDSALLDRIRVLSAHPVAGEGHSLFPAPALLTTSDLSRSLAFSRRRCAMI
jgi:hypothetical protein